MTMRMAVLLLPLGLLASAPVRAQPARHPLDPLSAEEIRLAVLVLEQAGRVGPHTRFALIELNEPPKSRVREDLSSGTFRREAYVQLYDWATTTAADAVVDLEARRELSWTALDSREPPTFSPVFDRVAEIVRADPRWAEALRRRGITNEDAIRMAPVGIEFGRPLFEGRDSGDVVMPVATWVNNATSREATDLYLRIDVNLNRGVVTRFEDRLPSERPEGVSYVKSGTGRPALKPLSIEQRDGPSFEIRGSHLKWQKWDLRFGVNPRRGLELYDIAYRDGDRRRTILYRASISEMVAPYGDPGWISFYPPD